MNREKGLAYCGLACCVCGDNETCAGCRSSGCKNKGWCKHFNCCKEIGLSGCWECAEFPCGGMHDKLRIFAFAKYIGQNGEEKIMDCLESNEKAGVVYHYPGQIVGDYDKCKTVDEIIDMLEGKASKLLIVDGSNLLFQMFFGMPARIPGKDGRPIHGTLGFVGALIKIIKKVEPTHVAVLFDGEHENPRSELSAEYKANRPSFADAPEEENPFSQLPDIYAALDCMGILHAEIEEVEGDDVMASYSITYGDKMKIVIASYDSDFFQLINENVSVLRYRGDKTIICDEAFLTAKFGITPDQYADFKSLTGDASDNIKGAYRIGFKTAAALLQQFGNLQSAIEKADEIIKPSIRESIKQNSGRLKINYDLIKLDDTASMPFTLEQLKYSYNGMTTNEVLGRIGIR